MKIFRDEKTQGLKRMIEFVEIFANIKRFAFLTFIKACKLLNKRDNEGLKTEMSNVGEYFYK